jgi:hypothetical protein
MIIYDIPKNASKSEAEDNQQIPAPKIIDFFAAREALRSEAKSVVQIKAQQARYHAAGRPRKQVRLFDLVEDFLFIVLIAAAILGLLAISGFG